MDRLVPVLEVHQFAQEAVVAEAWLTAQEPFINSQELGSSVDEVEQLIRRHEAFRKAAATWEERFSSLRRLTTVRAHTEHLPTAEQRDRGHLTVHFIGSTSSTWFRRSTEEIPVYPRLTRNWVSIKYRRKVEGSIPNPEPQPEPHHRT